MTTLNIAYCNVRGLNENCLNNLLSSIHTNQINIVVAAETWFMNRTQYKSHSFFIAESTYPTNPSTCRRQDGGLVLLASPSIANKLYVTSTTKYSINIQIDGSNLSFVYFPPSLSDNQIDNELKSIGFTNCIIGDFNIRLGNLSGDKLSNAKSRKITLYNYLHQYHLSYIRNNNISTVSRTDHIFTNLHNITWTYDSPSFKSDHQIMNISIDGFNIPTLPSLGTKRYDLKPLHNPFFKEEFISIFETKYASNLNAECEAALKFCCHSMILPNSEDTQEIIDITYNYFIYIITQLLEHTLTCYDAQSVKSKPDLLAISSNEPISNYHIIRCFKRSQRNINARNPIISSESTKTPLEECTTHYSNQFNSNENPPEIERQNDIMLSINFTEELIKKRILNYSLLKSIGPDNIHTIVWKTLSHSTSFMRSLSALYQLFAATSLIPSQWSTCNLHLLKKVPSNPTAANTRPIALCAVLRRLFEQILLKQMLLTDEPWTHLNYGQAGFRRGYSTLSHLILSDELSRRGKQYSIFLDIKSAFDSISWMKLNQLLISRNCPPSYRNLILSLICKPANLLLSVNQSERVLIKTKKGIFQGGGISAFIFSLYIDPLAIALNASSKSHSPLALLFADDIQIKAESIIEAQKALDICTTFALDYNLKWNLKKCAVISSNPTLLTLDNQLIPSASEYKYLGVIHKLNRLDLQTTYQNQLKKQSNLLTTLLDNNWHPKAKLTIYRTFIRPLTEYCSVLLYIYALKNPSNSHILTLMKSQHEKALKWIFSRKKYLKILDFLSDLGPWNHRMDCLRAGLTRSLQSMSPYNPLLKAKPIFFQSSSNYFILPECFKSSYWKEYQKVKYENPMKPLRFKTWSLRKLKSLMSCASLTSALISYLRPSHYPYPVISFNIPSKLFFDVLAWRTNQCLSRSICLCGSAFRRSHLDCVLITDQIYSTILESPAFLQSRQIISSSHSANFTVLDFLLNKQDYDLFNVLQSRLR
jgi:hypothetical protein